MEFANALGKRIESIAPADLTVLQQYSWPGNIRELRNVVERAIILAQGSRLAIPLPVVSVPRVQTAGDSNSDRMTDVERDHIRKVLDTAGWRIRGTGGAAERLGMRPTTLETRMAKLGLTRLRRRRSFPNNPEATSGVLSVFRADSRGIWIAEPSGTPATPMLTDIPSPSHANATVKQSRPIIGESRAVRAVQAAVAQVARTDATVLLLGETGTGKELFASQIHELSARRGRPMVRVNCAAIPSTLIESELFGRERGAFTDAIARQAGRFELADRSTIFLDEIGDLPPEVQVKLLRVLEDRQVERLGSPRPISVDVRIIAATHRNLEARVAEGTFRDDLFYRLNVFPITVPPLRERAEDIPLLVRHFIEEFSEVFGKRLAVASPANISALQRYSWPGNIRELRNSIERAMVVATGPELTIPVPAAPRIEANRSLKLVDVQKAHIHSVLEAAGWRIRGVGGAAERLGLRPTTLETRMARLGLVRPRAH